MQPFAQDIGHRATDIAGGLIVTFGSWPTARAGPRRRPAHPFLDRRQEIVVERISGQKFLALRRSVGDLGLGPRHGRLIARQDGFGGGPGRRPEQVPLRERGRSAVSALAPIGSATRKTRPSRARLNVMFGNALLFGSKAKCRDLHDEISSSELWVCAAGGLPRRDDRDRPRTARTHLSPSPQRSTSSRRRWHIRIHPVQCRRS